MSRTLRIVIYDGWLETLGGAERQVLAAADGLRSLGKVTVVSHRRLDRRQVVERSGLGLHGVRLVARAETPDFADVLEGLEPDVFINATHHSPLPSVGRVGIRFVYFPPPPPPWLERAGGALAGRLGERLAAAREVQGWYGPESWGRGWYRQSGARGSLRVRPGARLRLWLGDMDPSAGAKPRRYRVVTEDGRILAEGVAGAGGHFAPSPSFQAPPGCPRVVVETEPRLIERSGERRLIGLALGSIDEGGGLTRRACQRLWRRAIPALGRWEAEQRLTDYRTAFRSYRVVSPNSRYTAAWLRRWWGVDGEVIHPPVMSDDRQEGHRDALIVSIGRFFTGGHNKKHLVMVDAFRELVERGLRGWRLALAGGVGERAEDRAYLETVRRASRGLPVEIYGDAEESVVRALRQRASLCWHAAGHGESETRHPERYEHFGMAVAELMASGAVPVVIDGGGLREIVAHGESGFRWRRRDELAAHTLRLVRDARLRQTMGEAARRRAEQWSVAEYQRRIVALVERVREEAPQAATKPA